MGEVSTIGLDLAKSVFQAHGADASGAVLFRKKLRRHQVLAFFAAQPPCTVAMEACASAHHWAREIGRLGHAVRLIPPAYVKPFVKRQKNDAADAEAICEAAQRPTMRFVAPKSEQAQAAAIVFRARSSREAADPDHQCSTRSFGGVRARQGQRAGSRSTPRAGYRGWDRVGPGTRPTGSEDADRDAP
jgi:transposase